ncbi:MAG TPA: hypothetical protein PKI19_09855 [Elusimicrobiales bacterium]|nr:hypothetical protein [Elusimicrobiales bacterium]
MKNLLRAVLLAALAAGVFAQPAKADPFSDFKTQLQLQGKTLLKPFVEDFGGLIGGADFNSGRALGFPGFDVGLAMTVQSKPNADNKILKDADVKAFGVPLLRAAVGLPVIGADIELRGLTLSGLSIIGGGVRYPVFKSGTLTMFIPDVAVSAFYDAISYDYFTGSHMSVDAVASFNIPVVKPFVGVGLDRTTLEVKGVSTLLNGIDATISKPRYTIGVKFSPLPLLYVYGAYSSLHGVGGYNAGLGARF